MIHFKSHWLAFEAAVALSLVCQVVSAQNFFSNTVITPISGVTVNRAVYDTSRDLIYATVPSSFGSPNGDSLVVVDPNTSSIVNFVNAAGSDPNAIAISDDNSVVYFGVDGASAFRSFNPATNAFGALQSVSVPGFGARGPAEVEDIVVQPGNPNVVLVSADATGSTRSGTLQAYDANGLIDELDSFFNASLFRTANSIDFLDPNTIITFNNTSTGADLQRLGFDGTNLNQQQTVGGVFSGFGGTVEVDSGSVFFSTGEIVDPNNLTSLGSFPIINGGALEHAAAENLTYAFSVGNLQVFDNSTQAQLDVLNTNFSSARDLFFAGTNRLAVVDNNGQLAIIDGVQITAVPEPACGVLVALYGCFCMARRRRSPA